MHSKEAAKCTHSLRIQISVLQQSNIQVECKKGCKFAMKVSGSERVLPTEELRGYHCGMSSYMGYSSTVCIVATAAANERRGRRRLERGLFRETKM